MEYGPDNGLSRAGGGEQSPPRGPDIATPTFEVINLLTEPNKMAKRNEWHSIKQSVHHNDSNCNTGNNIEQENRRSGTGGKPLCTECRRLG